MVRVRLREVESIGVRKMRFAYFLMSFYKQMICHAEVPSICTHVN